MKWRLYKTCVFLLIVYFLNTDSLAAQHVDISGIVKSMDTNEVLAGAHIQIKNTFRGDVRAGTGHRRGGG